MATHVWHYRARTPNVYVGTGKHISSLTPYKRPSRISRHFWSPDFTRIRDQKEFFNSHATYRHYLGISRPFRVVDDLRNDSKTANYGVISNTVPPS